jgi:hypothetical protein
LLLSPQKVELQKEMWEAACKITSQTELRGTNAVQFVLGDFLHVRAPLSSSPLSPY